MRSSSRQLRGEHSLAATAGVASFLRSGAQSNCPSTELSGFKVFRSIVVLAAAGALSLGLTACIAEPSPGPDPAAPSASPAATSTLTDPIAELTNKDSDFYVGESVTPHIHHEGSGPTTLDVARPEAFVTELKFFVTCAPASHFTVTMEKFYSGQCSTKDLSSSGSIPLPAGKDPLSVSIDVPKGVHFWLVAIPIQ